MKYMLLIYGAESCWTESERKECMQISSGICEKLAAAGKLVASSPLHSVVTAKAIRVRDGKTLVTDGPFAETSEQLGGYYIVDVASIEEAMEIAATLPPASVGTVEVRPIFDLSGLFAPDENAIFSKRHFRLAREKVFQAISDPIRLARWFGPSGFRNTFDEFDFRPGGHWRFTMHGPNGVDYPNHCVFESIVEPELVQYSHLSQPNFRMTMTLSRAAESETVLSWRMQFEDQRMRDAVAKIAVDANEQNFDRLTEELQRGPS